MESDAGEDDCVAKANSPGGGIWGRGQRDSGVTRRALLRVKGAKGGEHTHSGSAGL